MDTPDFIKDIAQRRVDTLQTEGEAFDRRDALRVKLETRGTSAVALEELRLLEDICDNIEYDREQQAKAEVDAENAWLIQSEMPTAEDEAFARYESDLGLS